MVRTHKLNVINNARVKALLVLVTMFNKLT